MTKRAARIQGLKKILYYIIYILLAMTGSFAVVGGAYMDELFGQFHIFEMMIEACLILLVLVYAASRKELKKLRQKKFLSVYILAGLIPAIFQAVTQASFIEDCPAVGSVAELMCRVLMTAIWEELFFRYVGRSLFEKKDGTYAVADVILLPLVFCIPHFTDVFFYDPIEVAFQILAAFGMGMFLLALYRKTENIFTVIFSRFMTLAVIAVCRDYGSGQLFLQENISDIIFSVGIAVNVLGGLIILWNNRYFQDKRF